MEEASYPPETPYFGPNKNTNLSQPLKIKLGKISESIEKGRSNKKAKRKKSKIKTNKSTSEKFSLNLDKENRYYELFTKKIKLRNDFDRKHVEKILADAEEAFEGCDLDDRISEDDS